MRMIIIAVVALLVLGGGGAGAYFYFVQSAEASAGADAGEGHDEVKEDKHAKKGGHSSASVEFVELTPLILPIVDNNGISQTISLVVALEVADKEAAEEVERLAPRLTDAFIQDMYGMLSRQASLKGGVIQVKRIKERLVRISDEVLGEDVVQDVLLQVVQQRPL